MKKLFFLLLFVAVVGGVGYGVWTGMAGQEWQDKLKTAVDDVKAKVDAPTSQPTGGDGKTGTGEKTPVAGTAPTGTAPTGTGGTGPDPTPTQAGRSMTLVAAQTMLDAALKHYKNADFKAALEKLQPLVASPPDEKIGAEATRLSARSRSCAEILDGVPETDRANPTDMVDVILMSGNPMRGTLVSDTPAAVTIRKSGGIEAKISKSRVKEVVRLDPEKLREALEADLAAQLKKRSAPSATDYYELALTCYRNRLDHRVGELLEKALEKDPNLVKTVHHEKARNTYDAYVWFTGRGNTKDAKRLQELLLAKYSDTPYAAMLKETMEEIASASGSAAAAGGGDTDGDAAGGGGTEAGPSLSSAANDQAKELVAKANAKYDEGLDHYNRAEPGSPNRREENRKAFECFNEALGMYEEAWALTNGDNALARRIDQVRAIKVLTFRRQKALN